MALKLIFVYGLRQDLKLIFCFLQRYFVVTAPFIEITVPSLLHFTGALFRSESLVGLFLGSLFYPTDLLIDPQTSSTVDCCSFTESSEKLLHRFSKLVIPFQDCFGPAISGSLYSYKILELPCSFLQEKQTRIVFRIGLKPQINFGRTATLKKLTLQIYELGILCSIYLDLL